MKYLEMSEKMDTPIPSHEENMIEEGSPMTPTKSRFGRSHKPKALGDFVSTDKRVSMLLKLNPSNQLAFYIDSGKKKSPKKERTPKKSPAKDKPKGIRRSLLPAIKRYPIPDFDAIVEPDELEPVPGCEWLVGDLAWARVGNHPFWPCIINRDPALGIFTRIRMFSRSLVPMRRLHVQFFGDNGRRSWLSSSAVMNYAGREAFNKLSHTILSGMKRKDPRQVSALVVKPNMKSVWETAVAEAESLLNSSREDRLLHFKRMYPVVVEQPRDKLNDVEILDGEGNLEAKPVSVERVKRTYRKRKAEDKEGDYIVAKKQIKLQPEEPNIGDDDDDDDDDDTGGAVIKRGRGRPTGSAKRLSILERVKLSQQAQKSAASSPAAEHAEIRSPSVRLKERRVEEERKRVIEEIKIKEEVVSDDGSEQAPVLKEPITVNKQMKGESDVKKKKKRRSKLGADFNLFSSKHIERVSEEHPDMKTRDVEKYLEKMWQDMDKSQKLKYRSRVTVNVADKTAEDDEEVDLTESSEISDDLEERTTISDKSGSPPPLAASVSKSVKQKCRLFNGALPVKVCQICEKPGNTLRCKGPCFGTYHLECAMSPREFSASLKEKLGPVEKSAPKKGGRGRKRKSTIALDSSKNDSLINNNKDENNLAEGYEKVSVIEVDSKHENSVTENKDRDDKIDLKEVVQEEATNKNKNDPETEEKVEEEKDVKPEKKKARGKGSKESSESGEEVDGQTDFKCADCSEGRLQPCFVCGEEEKNGNSNRQRCHIAYCGKVYHSECLKAWPQTSWTLGGSRRGANNTKSEPIMSMACPQHACHTCVSDNPGVMKARFINDKLVRCLRCPTSYHYGNHCLPAGSEVVTNRQIICPQHYRVQRKNLQHVNAAWCFICASGGSLICCDLCPTAFHADCLKISPPEGGYICEDCETGRFPLHGEIVWVKLGHYRWWPAQILFPFEIPENIQNLTHSRGEFAVRFFGSHDFYWVNRGRVFLFQEGDSGKCSSKNSSTDQVFIKAVQEASETFMKLKSEKDTRDAENRSGLKPPTYIKIKTNKPVGQVRTMESNISSMTPCECDPTLTNPCALDSDCLNRILMVECNPLLCPAGERCKNQLFEKRQYPPLVPYRTEGRGWGLKTLVDLKKGDFVIEYVGEMIDEQEYQKRLKKMHEGNYENYYFLTIDKDRMLDAGPKGNVARFMNHSCQPNCETQKWTVNGDTRVGLFALCDIPAENELVFNYNLESIGTDKKPCMCGAPNCSGFIGVKANKTNNSSSNNGDEDKKKGLHAKKGVNKKVKAKVQQSEDVCFMCGEGGELLLCDSKACLKGYHLSCLSRNKWPQGKWLCPWHQCNVCSKGRVRRCSFCVNSYCPNHADGNIQMDETLGRLVCSKHDDKADKSTKSEKLKPGEKPEQDAHADDRPALLGIEVDPTMDIDEEHELTPPPLAVTPRADTPAANDSGPSVDRLSASNKKPPTRYRNRRSKSNSDINSSEVNGEVLPVATASVAKRKRPISVDSPISAPLPTDICGNTTDFQKKKKVNEVTENESDKSDVRPLVIRSEALSQIAEYEQSDNEEATEQDSGIQESESGKEEIDIRNNINNEDVVEDKTNNEDVVEDKIQNEDTVEDKIQNEDKVEDKIQNEDKVEDKIQNEDLVEDKIQTEDMVEDKIQNEDMVEEKIQNEDLVEDKIHTEDVVLDKNMTNDYLEDGQPDEEPRQNMSDESPTTESESNQIHEEHNGTAQVVEDNTDRCKSDSITLKKKKIRRIQSADSAKVELIESLPEGESVVNNQLVEEDKNPELTDSNAEIEVPKIVEDNDVNETISEEIKNNALKALSPVYDDSITKDDTAVITSEISAPEKVSARIEDETEFSVSIVNGEETNAVISNAASSIAPATSTTADSSSVNTNTMCAFMNGTAV